MTLTPEKSLILRISSLCKLDDAFSDVKFAAFWQFPRAPCFCASAPATTKQGTAFSAKEGKMIAK
jgi:hypothetical protein